MMALSSCFGRECVCTVKVDGEKQSKSIDYQDKCDKTGEWTQTINGTEYDYKCK